MNIEPLGSIDVTNKQLVSVGSSRVVVMNPQRVMTPAEAMVQAAWLVTLAAIEANMDHEEALDAFGSILAYVANT